MNYKHLLYFWMVAKEGSVTRASELLHVTPQTISGQLSLLESYYNVKLFNKVGRNLELSSTGHQVFGYANDIFSLGDELDQLLKILPENQPKIFNVGIIDVVPKSIAHQILLPAVKQVRNIRMNCREGGFDNLLADLMKHKLDLLIAERPIPVNMSLNAISRKLGESRLSFFASPALIKNLDENFPDNLNGAPLLLPNTKSQTYSVMEQWLSKNHIQANVVAEFDDSALMKAFGREGVGIFPGPSVLSHDIESQYQVKEIGHTDELKQSYYAIYVERREITPVVQDIINEAGQSIFA